MMVGVLWFIAILLLVLWALGFAVNIGVWVNFLLLAAVVVLVVYLVTAFARTAAHDTHDHDHYHD